LVFCLEDGATLSAPYDPNATLHLPHSQSKPSDSQATLQFPSSQTKPQDPNATFELPNSETIEQPRQKKSNLSWWLLGASGIVIVGLVALLALFVILSLITPRIVDQPANSNQPKVSSSPAPNNETEDVETTLRRLNDDIGSAFRRADIEVLERYLADDYTYQDYNDVITTKSQIIALLRDGTISYNYVASSNVSVSVEPNRQRAKVAGQGIVKGQLNGAPFVEAWNFSNVYEKRNGLWQLVSVKTSL
jgi:hypothetical protein